MQLTMTSKRSTRVPQKNHIAPKAGLSDNIVRASSTPQVRDKFVARLLETCVKAPVPEV